MKVLKFIINDLFYNFNLLLFSIINIISLIVLIILDYNKHNFIIIKKKVFKKS